jgi:hypothetical protein
VLTTLNKGLVNWVKILAAAHARYPIKGGGVHSLVLEVQAGWVPSHSHLGVNVIGDIKIGVDLRYHSQRYAGHANRLERVLEHYL